MTIFEAINESLSKPIGESSIIGWHLVIVAIAVFPFLLISTVFRKQWDRIPGVWRCMILSGIAHVLLIFFAYGTRFVVVQDGVGMADLTPVGVIDEEILAANAQPEDRIPSWDSFSSETEVPAVEPLDRPIDEPELVLEQQYPGLDNPFLMTDAMPVEAPSAMEGSFQIPEPVRAAVDDAKLADAVEVPLASDPPAVEFETPTTPTPLMIEQPAVTESAEPKLEDPWLSESFSELDNRSLPDTPIPVARPEQEDESKPIAEAKFELPKATETPLPSQNVSHERLAELTPKKSLSTPRRMGDSQPMPEIYAERFEPDRLKAAMRRGGSLESEAAVQLALKYLAANQLSDGRWSSKTSGGGIERQVLGQDRQGAGARADCGITGLALLCFLSAGNTQFEGEYRDTVRQAISFLTSQQDSQGCLAGPADKFSRMYCHSMAMLALSESLAITGDPNLLASVEQAVGYSVRAQNKNDGGWRYSPGDSGDMSQFGWQVLSLHSADLGGVQIPEVTVHGMQRFLLRCVRGKSGGLGCYRPEEGPSVTMTAEALVTRFLLQESVDPATIDEASQWILQNPPSRDAVNYYYWYYGTMAMHHAGGRYWDAWNERLQPVLLAHQIRSGKDNGAWPADGVWSGYGGQVYSTALATLCLESYYRYVPVQEIKQKTR